MSHLYEVTTSTGSCLMTDATNSQEAKKIVCKKLRISQSDPWAGLSSMKAKKVIIDFPEVNYQPSDKEEALQQYVGKDIIIYDEHHGTATRIRKATVVSLQYYLDEYSTIIVLE